MKEENVLVVFALLIIAVLSLGIVGFIVYNNGPKDSLNPLIMIANTVVSGFIGYLTKSAVTALKNKEPETPKE